VALITDGRFSGCSRGPVIGHVSPEAAAGGPLAVVEDGDLIEVNLHKRTLNLVGVAGEHRSPAQIDEILARRLQRWQPPPPKYKSGLAGLFTHLATSASEGGVMRWE
jgi:dihydroxy-acid dehydratase